MVGSPRGLPHRDPRPHEGTDGEERGDRARGSEGWLRGEAAADHERSRCAAGRGRGLLPDPDQRTARHHRQHRRRHGRPTGSRRPLRRATIPTSSSLRTRGRPPSPTSRTRSPPSTASGWATRSPRVALRATTTRRWASRPAARGSRCDVTSSGSASTPTRIRSRSSGSATCPATCSATGCCSRRRSQLVGAFDHRHVFLDPKPDPAASFAERRRLFDLPRSSWDDYDRSLISQGGGVWPRVREVDPAVRRSPRSCSAPRRRRSHRPRSSPRSCGPRSTCSSTAGSAPTSRRPPSRTARSATAPTTAASRRCRPPLPRRRRGREPRPHATRPHRVRARRRAREHRRDRQLGRRRHVRPRGQHQDPPRRRSRRRRPDREAAERVARRDVRRGRCTWCCGTTTSRTGRSPTPAPRQCR